MRHISFNEGWNVRPKGNSFSERMGSAAEWLPVTLPHDALIGTERSRDATAATGFFPSGVWEYQKDFELPEADAKSAIFLEFEGVYRDALVYVNGNFACHRPYGYSGFTTRIDGLLRYGATNTVRVESRVHDDSRWYTGAGIYRNVWLLVGEKIHLEPNGIRVMTPDVTDQVAAVSVSIDICNESDQAERVQLRIDITDQSGTLVAHTESPVSTWTGATVNAHHRIFVASPRRWSLADPHLYSCRVRLFRGDELLDEERTTFGIRSLTLDPVRGLCVNGEAVLLRGACIHHDNGVLGAATIERAEERRIEILKSAGFNAIRSAHNPMSVAMLNACDRLGMVVMDETFDMWTQTKSEDDYALRFPEWWEEDVAAMVRKDFNHPSVVLYSIGNEVPEAGTPKGASTGRALAGKVRSLDSTRFVTQAISGLLIGGQELYAQLSAELHGPDEDSGVNTVMTNLTAVLSSLMLSPIVAEKSEETLSYLDAAGYNYMEARLGLDAGLYPHRVIVATETHAPAIGTGWAAVTEHSHVIGDFTWTGWDYLGEAGIGRVEYADEASGTGMSAFLGEFPWLTAWCGDIDITGERRPQSYFREIVFGLRTDPYIAVRRPQQAGQVVVHSSPWSWSDAISSWSWEGCAGTALGVEVYSDADEVELLLNGISQGTRPAGSAHGYRTEFEVNFESGELEAIAWSGGLEVGRTSLRSASGPVELDVRVDRDEISSQPTDLAFIALSLVDPTGSPVTSLDRTITIGVEGPAVLQGLGSANPMAVIPFTASSCLSFDGRALAIIRPTGAGDIAITATAEGCKPRTVSIQARG